MTASVRLKPGHVQPVWAGHPWIYAQAVERVEGGATRGDEVRVLDPRGNFLGRGFYSPGSAIPVRIVSRSESEKLDALFFRGQVARALEQRKLLELGDETTGYRLIHAEGDGLPGLVVDRMGDVLVLQILTAGMKQREHIILDALEENLRPKAIIDRTPEKYAKAENFTYTPGFVRGKEVEALDFKERGMRFRVPLALGQKTGFYFDQRTLRGRVEALAHGKKVLDAYGYIGSFGLFSARGNAESVTSVDENPLVGEIGAECARLNGLGERVRFIKDDARRLLQDCHAEYDLVVLDPPRLAPTRSARENALVHYAKLAALGCRATRPGGILVFCSCSSAIDLHALTRALATGAQRANVEAVVLERHFQAADHPVPAAFGEGLYLKSVIARIRPR